MPPSRASATKTSYAPGQAFDFTLILMGKAVDFLPYFILAFREVAREGIGLNRARCNWKRRARRVRGPLGSPVPPAADFLEFVPGVNPLRN